MVIDTFIEPSAGTGVFYDLLPKSSRLGIDIASDRDDIRKQDFFSWQPSAGISYAAIGNPPFGSRGWLALAFLNRLACFCDMVGFILPMYFDSDGKGSAKSRVKGLHLVHSERLPNHVFYRQEDKVTINVVWQIWAKHLQKRPKLQTCYEFIDVYTVCTYPSRRCGLKRMNRYDYFIASTFYKSPKVVQSFDEVNYGSGYGIIIKKDKENIRNLLFNVDWSKYCSVATNHCYHISKQYIFQLLIDHGYIDKQLDICLNKTI